MKSSKKTRPNRLIGYCRVSTEGQVEEGISLDAQRAKIEQYAQLHDYELVEIFTDAGFSGKNLDRPGLSEALARLRGMIGGGLVVVKLDRLTRSVRDLGYLIEHYFAEDKRHTIMSINEQFDTSTANGRFMLYLLNVVSQWEREIIGERTKDAMAYLKTQGVAVGAPPYGYCYAPEPDAQGRFVLVEVLAEQRTIRLIQKLRSEGLTLHKIALKLIADGIPTKKDGAWHGQTISDVLKRGG